ncbi:hypothetical protein DUNSADRAFT_3390 [Dunaliella salina]|uniref:Uncharacterized protein n=1 Tax=Dunaliella salina TaxID=3046 RepID=A0ABQ7FVF2_DUNSA|nr:hypothetical protein DUNSADRAFT_3390 [Dunaliella salina]|eukprot:KAF5826366.1 hypothetical protein DUNSADRAFT_3390 [Dunaliella salina]
MELVGAERDQYEQLLSKYKGAAGNPVNAHEGVNSSLTQSLAQPGKPDPPRPQGTDVDVRPCLGCDSSGTVTELYNFRRLEKCCPKCEGKGVFFYRNGQLVPEGEFSANQRRSSGSSGSGKLRNPAKTAKELAAVGAKLRQYEQPPTSLDRPLLAYNSVGTMHTLTVS